MSAADREKWDRKYAATDAAPSEPSAVLLGLERYLPARGRALDIAGGAGRNALWLAQREMDVTLADISPVGLAIARQRAADAGLRLATVEIDVREDQLELGAFDLVVSVCFLWRPLLAQLTHLLAPDGT